jgi:hypothetical protein
MLIGRKPGEARKGKVTMRDTLIGAGQRCTPRDTRRNCHTSVTF